MWLIVDGRAPTRPNICSRSRTSFTGRFTTFAAMAHSGTWDHIEPLEPKPPPTSGSITRTLSTGMLSDLANDIFTPDMYCVVSYAVFCLKKKEQVLVYVSHRVSRA